MQSLQNRAVNELPLNTCLRARQAFLGHCRQPSLPYSDSSDTSTAGTPPIDPFSGPPTPQYIMEGGVKPDAHEWTEVSQASSFANNLWDPDHPHFYPHDNMPHSTSESVCCVRNHGDSMLYQGIESSSDSSHGASEFNTFQTSLATSHPASSAWLTGQQPSLTSAARHDFSSSAYPDPRYSVQNSLLARPSYSSVRGAPTYQQNPVLSSSYNLQPPVASTSHSHFASQPQAFPRSISATEYTRDQYTYPPVDGQMLLRRAATNSQATTSSSPDPSVAYGHPASLGEAAYFNATEHGTYLSMRDSSLSITPPTVSSIDIADIQSASGVLGRQNAVTHVSALSTVESSRRARRTQMSDHPWTEHEANGVTVSFLGKPWINHNGRYVTGAINEAKPHKCKFVSSETGELCGSSFERSEHLKRHMASHSSERPFPCPLPGCDKRIGRSDNAGDHFKTHLRPATKGKRNKHFKWEVLEKCILERYNERQATKLLCNLRKWMASESSKCKDDTCTKPNSAKATPRAS